MRYVVVGTSGSGKSSFARKLCAITRSPHVELDALYWSENWRPRPRDEFEERVRQATSGEGWVVDGNYTVTRPIVWSRATHIVWLNYARSVVFPRILWRTLRRSAARETLWHGNRESFSKAFLSKQSILLWSFTTYSKNVVKYTALSAGTNILTSFGQSSEVPGWRVNTFVHRLHLAPNHSIERTSQRPLRTLCAAPHVER